MRKNRLALAILLALVVGLMAMPAQWMPAEAQSKWQVEVVSGETRVVLTESDLNRMKPVSAKAAFCGRPDG